MTGKEFLELLADQLASDLTANDSIKRFTTNPSLLGAYAEATVRRLVHQIVAPLRISRGAIIYEDICPASVPEIDTIIWSPCPIPAVFELGEFALVPRHSAFAFLEIKRSNYNGEVGSKILRLLDREDELVPLLEHEVSFRRAIGVICIREYGLRDTVLDGLVKSGRAVVLLEKHASGNLVANRDAIHSLVNFLQNIRLHGKLRDGIIRSNWEAIRRT